MERRVLILYNPKAGKGRIRRKMDAVEEVFFTAGYTPVPKMLRFGENPFDSLDGEYELVVICGGDGTINYVINAMKARGLDYLLAIIPAGTANDFAGAIGMHSNPVKAARQIVEGRQERVDCGRVNGLYFINIFSFGMFTTTSQHTPEHLKQHIGKAAYIIEGSKELHNREYIPLHIVHDGGEMDINSVITLIFTMASYTYGPLLGMFLFGLITRRTINERAVPIIALLSPLLCYVVSTHSAAWLGGYTFSYEIIILNATLTMAGLWMFSSKRE